MVAILAMLATRIRTLLVGILNSGIGFIPLGGYEHKVKMKVIPAMTAPGFVRSRLQLLSRVYSGRRWTL
jgi:hypothetical protein